MYLCSLWASIFWYFLRLFGRLHPNQSPTCPVCVPLVNPLENTNCTFVFCNPIRHLIPGHICNELAPTSRIQVVTWVSEWVVSEWVSEWASERASEWVSEWVSEWDILHQGEFFHRGRRLEASWFWNYLCIFVHVCMYSDAFEYFWICYIVVFWFKREDWNQSPLERESMLDIRKQQSWLPRCAMEGIFKLLPLLLPTSNQDDCACAFVAFLLDLDVITLKKGKNKTG